MLQSRWLSSHHRSKRKRRRNNAEDVYCLYLLFFFCIFAVLCKICSFLGIIFHFAFGIFFYFYLSILSIVCFTYSSCSSSRTWSILLTLQKCLLWSEAHLSKMKVCLGIHSRWCATLKLLSVVDKAVGFVEFDFAYKCRVHCKRRSLWKWHAWWWCQLSFYYSILICFSSLLVKEYLETYRYPSNANLLLICGHCKELKLKKVFLFTRGKQ